MIRMFLKDGRELAIPTGVDLRVRPYRLAAKGSGEETTYVIVDAEEDGNVVAAVLAADVIAWVKEDVPAAATPESVDMPISLHAPFTASEPSNGTHAMETALSGQRVMGG
jgi:hypothetical protein